MKKITLTLSIIAFSAVFTTSALAQISSAEAVSSAEVITPVSILKNGDLKFGTFSTDPLAAGSILLSATSVATPSSEITLTTLVTPSAASFVVSGDSNYTYSIVLPAEVVLSGLVEANEMTVDDFTSSLTDNKGTLATGTQTFTVGGTLNVPIGTVKDVYSNASDLTVSVNYN
jgi:hypothetical protein